MCALHRYSLQNTFAIKIVTFYLVTEPVVCFYVWKVQSA